MLQKKQEEDSSTVKPKERRVVTWTQEEDDILREQITIHGTENWTIIASKFKDKTTRQCRRRWYTYLNSDFKKGGWSLEEDMLLCEAQKIFGNRWTEIAKVVSGRTDNAVKNRFSTLCKKRAKHEALANKENNNAFMNSNNKRVSIDNKFHSPLLKKLRRAHIPLSTMEDCNSVKQRLPFAGLDQNVNNNSQITTNKEGLSDDKKKAEGAFLSKNDPKVAALMQQAELLSSLAVKVNSDTTNQSLENAWKVLQNFFGKGKDSEEIRDKIGNMDDLKELMEELRSNNSPPPRLYDSPSSSEYSTGSTILSQTEISTMHKDILQDNMLLCNTTDQEFSSPIQVTPLFRSMASTIPSPQFSESERHFLLRTLGIDSPTRKANTMVNAMQSPPCRKSLLQGL